MTSRPDVIGHPMERGHELVGGIERQRRDPRISLACECRVHTALRGEDDEGALGRVADERTVLHLGVRAEGHRHVELLELPLRLPADLGDLAVGRIALSGDRVAPTDDGHLDGRHLVERERAGLVGVDGRGGPERLDRAQALHDRPGGRQLLGPGRQDRGDHGR